MLSQEIYRGCAITSSASTSSSLILLQFILPPTLQATIWIHLLSVVLDVAEAGSAVVIVVVDVPSHYHISLSVADLNARSAIVSTLC